MKTPPPTPASPAARAPRHGSLVGGLVGGLLLFNFLLAIAALFYVVQLRRDVTYPEAAIVQAAWAAGNGQPVYTDWRQWPHRFSPYGPALYYPVGWLARWGLGRPAMGFHYYILGRTLACLALAGLWLVAIALARRMGGGSWLAPAAAVLGVAAFWPRVLGYVISYRPDTPAVLCSLLAVYLALGGLDTRRRRWAVLAALWGALLFKQSAWAAPLVVGWLAWRRLGLAGVARWGGLYLGGTILGAGAMDLATGGRFTLNTVWGLVNGFAMPPFVSDLLGGNLADYVDMLARVGLMAAWGVWMMIDPTKATAAENATEQTTPSASSPDALAWRALGLYFVLSLVLSAAQLAKVGSDVNYLLEPLTLSGVAAALAWRRWFVVRPPRLFHWTILLLLLVWPLAVNVRSNCEAIKVSRNLISHPHPEEILARRVRSGLMMDSAFIHPNPANRGIPDPVHYSIMVSRDKISPQPLLDRLAREQFDTIVLSTPARSCLWGEGKDGWAGRALEKYYRPQEGWNSPQVWVPKDRPVPRL